MQHRTLLLLGSLHALALAVSTYIAALEIESILVSGLICSATGLTLAITARLHGRPQLALAGGATPALALLMTVLEAAVLQLGPTRAAIPFSIVFIANQFLTTLIILVELHRLTAPDGELPRRVTLRALIVAMTSFCVFFAAAKYLLTLGHEWHMSVALGLMGLTTVGLTGVWHAALTERP